MNFVHRRQTAAARWGIFLATIVGTTGNDTLIGTSGDDSISGGIGDDVLSGDQPGRLAVSAIARIYANGGSDGAVFSPDGTKVAFAASDLFIVDLSTGAV